MYSSSTGLEHSFGGLESHCHLLVLSLMYIIIYIQFFYFPSKATTFYSFIQAIEFFCDLTNELYSCFGLVLSLPVFIVTLGCIWLARLFEKAGVLTLCLLNLLHYYMQQTMQNNVPCALV